MTGEGSDRPLAVLDTSFWVVAYRAEVAANCLDLFEIVVPRAVEAEIRAKVPSSPQREFPYATLFRHLRGHMLAPPADAPPSIDRFGAGEAEALAIAQHLGALLLIDERPAISFAVSLGVNVVTVPAVIVSLRSLGVIGDRAARRKLALIEPVTARAIVAEARHALDLVAATEQDGGSV